ncbi:peptidylprolyl isomerase [Paucibacter sp. O1-1]|nr:peptidylprolyl isomerase [Paucibacter sp. O1-1]MDA3824346.1 peptidylprolyl isomerase [Paucibacter sp. O1-1]
MNKLAPGALSAPVVSRFGVHLLRVDERRNVTLDPKEVREQARNQLREAKFEQAYADWVKELRMRAYIEMREPPLASWALPRSAFGACPHGGAASGPAKPAAWRPPGSGCAPRRWPEHGPHRAQALWPALSGRHRAHRRHRAADRSAAG